MPNTEQLQDRIAGALRALAGMHRDGTLPPILQPLLAIAPPAHAEAVVELHGVTPRGWDPRQGEVSLRYVDQREATPHGAEDGDGPPFEPMPELIQVLAEAEDNPQLHFVALKFLRDRLLPQRENSWSHAPPLCQRAIATAIEEGAVKTTKKPNPRNPEFPVTAVELNRDHPLVREVLGEADAVAQEPRSDVEARAALAE